MMLLEYIYFQSLQWMRRQGRRPQDAIDTAIMPLGLSLGLYSLGTIGLIDYLGGVNLTLTVAGYWPKISEHGKFIKPMHGIGVLVSFVILFFLYFFFTRLARREAIENWFAKTTSANEIKNGHWAVWAFVISSFSFAIASFFPAFWVIGLIIAALTIGNFMVYRRHFRGR